MTVHVLGIVLFFAVGLLFSIAWHELGHLTLRQAVQRPHVTQYMVGFGQTVWSKQVGETEYGFKAIPLGGYIRMIGMVPPRQGRQAARCRDRRTGPAGMIDDVRASSRRRTSRPDDRRRRQFYRCTRASGSSSCSPARSMNLILAVGSSRRADGHRQPPPQHHGRQRSASASSPPRPTVPPTTVPRGRAGPRRPTAGLLPGDSIVAVRRHAGRPVWDQPPHADPGRADGHGDDRRRTRGGAADHAHAPSCHRATGRGRRQHRTRRCGRGFLGIGLAGASTRRSRSAPCSTRPATVHRRAARRWSSFPARIPALWDAIFNGEPRDPNSPVGIVGAGRIGGEILRARHRPATDKLLLFLNLLAGFNMSLFLLQHAAAAAAGRRAHRRRDRRDGLAARLGARCVGRRPTRARSTWPKLMPVAYVVALLFIGLTALLTLRRRHRQPGHAVRVTRRVAPTSTERGRRILGSVASSVPSLGTVPAAARRPVAVRRPQDPADLQVGVGRRRQRAPGLRAVDDDHGHRRHQRHPAADRRADRVRLPDRPGRRARPRTTPRRCPRSPGSRRSR